MRVLHVVSSLDARKGGPAVAVAGLARAQKRQGLDVEIFNAYGVDESNAIADDLRAEGIDIMLIGPCAPFAGGTKLVRPALKHCMAVADIVHIHALWEPVQHHAALLAHKLGLPYLFRPCGMLDPWSLSQGWLKKRLYLMLRLKRDLNRAAALHYTASEERDLAQPLQLAPPGIIEPNGINLEEFRELPPPEAFRDKWPQIAGRKIILFLSRLHHKKGLDLLIPAFAQAKLQNCVLVIAGPDNDNYLPVVNQLINENHLQNDVILTGILRDRDRLEAMASAELFVLPSYQENFGIVVVEALAAGAPVIISDQVNIHREITAAGVGGVVPTQIAPLAEMLNRWMSDDALRAATRLKGRSFALKTFDWNEIAARWVAHYQALKA